MADSLSEFYSGPLLAPDRVGNTLRQSQIYSGPSSISDLYRGIYADAPKQASMYDATGPGANWLQFDDQFNSGPPTAIQAIDAAAPHASGTVDNSKMAYRMGGDATQLPPDLFGAPAPTGSAFNGGWGSGAFADLFAGVPSNPPVSGAPAAADPWQRDRFGTGVPVNHGLVTGGAPTATPAPSIPDLFTAPRSAPGYNGQTSVHSNELAGANRGFGGENAQMPNSMNNARWLTGY